MKSILILFLTLVSCGIKSKPLPPLQVTTQETESTKPTEKKK
jgi:predicted small lipoprotein YifL